MCTLSRQVRVMALGAADLTAVLRGDFRLRNFPADGAVVAICPLDQGKRVGLRIFSARYSSVPQGCLLPVVTAVLEQVTEDAT